MCIQGLGHFSLLPPPPPLPPTPPPPFISEVNNSEHIKFSEGRKKILKKEKVKPFKN
jgi:hypothetical protein